MWEAINYIQYLLGCFCSCQWCGLFKKHSCLFSKAAIEDVRAKNLICILDVDIQGVKRIKETDLDPIYISIQPPSMEVLVIKASLMAFLSCTVNESLHLHNTSCWLCQEKRLRDRQTETEESLQKRLEAARIDMELSEFLSISGGTWPRMKSQLLQLIKLWLLGKEPGVFDVVIINDDLERAYEELKEILDEVSRSIKCPCSFWFMKYFVISSSSCHLSVSLCLYRKLKKFRRPNHNKEIISQSFSWWTQTLVTLISSIFTDWERIWNTERFSRRSGSLSAVLTRRWKWRALDWNLEDGLCVRFSKSNGWYLGVEY